jgi:hypothetical protein
MSSRNAVVMAVVLLLIARAAHAQVFGAASSFETRRIWPSPAPTPTFCRTASA